MGGLGQQLQIQRPPVTTTCGRVRLLRKPGLTDGLALIQVRTIIQLTAATVFTVLVLVFLDRNFRVLPKTIHQYMPQHHAGLVVTDMTVKKCSSLNPFTTCRLDPEIWHRIDKDLYLGRGWFASAYLHVRRQREEDLIAGKDRVVVDISVGRLDPSSTAGSAKASDGDEDDKDERWEQRDCGIWLRRSASPKAVDSPRAITAVDVLFGDDAVEAREGWQMAPGTALLVDSPPDKETGNPLAAHITVRRGGKSSHGKETPKPQPRIGDNGRFKIMQVADLHLSTGVGKCRDPTPPANPSAAGDKCEADPRTLDFVEKMLEEEKPDLVVLSGDQVNGETAPDAQSAIFKFAALLARFKTPYVTIFGNHDDEGSLPRAAQMAIIETLPYSLSQAGPVELDGVGNYYIEILARGKSSHSALTIYLLDTHSYSPDEKRYKGYDWIKPSQIEWFRRKAQSLKKKHQEYTHVHMDVAFIHIPLPEYRNRTAQIKGEWKEGVTAPNFNSGFHDALVEQGVLMVSCGQ